MRRIAVQIALSFFALTVLTVGIGAVAAMLLGDMGGGVRRTMAENVQSVIAAERMGRALDAAELARRSGDSSSEADAHRAFQSALRQARDAAFLPEEPTLIDALGRAHAAYRADATSAATVDTLRTRLLVLNERAAEERAEQTSTAAGEAQRFLLLAVLCAVGASLVAGALLARRISRPLRELTAGVMGIGPGRFNARVGTGAGGEVGALSMAFNGLAERLEAYEALNLRALVREKRTAEALVASIPSPVVVTEGAERHVRLANAAAETLVGTQAHGRPLSDVFPELSAARTSHLGGAADLLVEVGAQTWRLRQTEVDVPSEIEDSVSGERQHTPPSGRLAVWVLDDVTPFRALDAARRDFLAAVSHELRTPLTSMHMAADLLLRDAAGPLTEEQRELAEIVRGDTERMKALTARLLDLARVEVGGRRGPVALEQLARDAAAGVRLPAAEHGITVVVEGQGLVDGDGDGLLMAVSNLVTNAVRHAASRVTVRIETGEHGARVSVEDDGPGLSKSDVDRVFDPLVQASSGTSGSAGLGLAIVRRVAEAHGGRAWAEPGPGGRFFFHLPSA